MLSLTGASVLGFNQVSKYFGSVFHYTSERNLTVKGNINTLSNGQGVSGIAANIQNYFNTDQDYSSIIINGYNFGSGKIKGVNFDIGNDVLTKTYTVDITCFQTGDLFNLGGSYYSGAQENAATPYYLLDTFDEKFDYTYNGERFGYTHGVNLRFNSGDSLGTSPINKAQTLASQLIYTAVPFAFFISGQNTGIGKKTYTESYDQITNLCSFEESYEREANNSGYIYYLTNGFERAANGISVVTETAQIEDLLTNPSVKNFNNLWSGMSLLLSGSYTRCNNLFNLYSGNAYPLFTGYLSLSKNINSFARIGNYSVAYTNNPSQVSGGYSWTYTNSIDKHYQYHDIKEEGSVIGHWNPVTNGLITAQAAFPAIQAGIQNRCNTLYLSTVTTSLPVNQTSQVKDTSIFRGGITYSADFSDDPDYNTNSSKVKQQNVVIKDDYPVLMLNKFNIFNYKEIVQPNNNATLGERVVNISLLGSIDSQLNDMKSYVIPLLNSYIPNGTDCFLTKVDYTYSPENKEFAVDAAWKYQTGAYTGIY